jgi:hypothetical protein
MKRLLLILSVFCFLIADSPVGNWKLSGLKVDYLNIARMTRTVALQDAYGVGVNVPVSEVPGGAVFYRLTNGPFTMSQIDNYPLNLNVNLYQDGTGAVAQGSFYPDIELIPGTCITSPQIFPVTDNFTFTVGDETVFPANNILGIPGINDKQGLSAFGFGVAGSGTFEDFPSTASPAPVPPGFDYIVAGTSSPDIPSTQILGATCQTALVSNACAALGISLAEDYDGCIYALVVDGQLSATQDGSGPLEQAIVGCEMATNPAYGGSYAGSANYGGAGWLHGSGTSGFFAVNGLGNSQVPGQEDMAIDFLLEWNGIDGGTEATLGIGDSEDDYYEDEYICLDADGNSIPGCHINTDADGNEVPGAAFDRIFGLPFIPMTNVAADCPVPGFDNLARPIAGDLTGLVADLVTGQCYDTVLAGVEQGCLDSVAAGVVAQCDGAGGVANMVFGQCVAEASGQDFADLCAAYGVTAAVTGACLDAGGPETAEEAAAVNSPLTCGDIGAQYDLATGGDCAGAASLASQDCATSNGASLCCLASAIGNGATDTDGDGVGECDAFAAGLSEDFLNEQAAAATGSDCPTTAANLQAGFDAGDASTIAYLDQLAAGVVGSGCGDYGAGAEAACITSVSNGNDMYLLDLSLAPWGYFLTYNAASYQQAMGGLLAAGYDETTAFGMILGNDDFDGQGGYAWTLVDDSSWGEFDPSCYADPNVTCGGKLHMNFDPLCVPVVEGRQIVAEFIDLNDVCSADGDVNYTCTDTYGLCTDILAANGLCPADDVNQAPVICSELIYGTWMNAGAQAALSAVGVDLSGCTPEGFGQPFPNGDILQPGECVVGDGITNVVDVVNIIGHILGTLEYTYDQCLANGFDTEDCDAGPVGYELGGTAGCAADINTDGQINVVDVVVIVGNILGRVANEDATKATVTLTDNNNISIKADGYIGGIDMVVEYEGDLNITFADNLVAEYVTNDNTARIVMVNDSSIEDVLTTTSGKITAIQSIMVATTDHEVQDVLVEMGTDADMPYAFKVSAAYPNPFNPTTKFSLELNTVSDISVKVYNLLGQLVDVVAEGTYSPKTYSWTWNAENLASGVYLVKTTVGNSVHKQKIMLLK